MSIYRLIPLAVVAFAAACNTYDPKLGYEPFQCGDTEPRCPLGYTCVSYEGGASICQETGVEVPDAGLPDDGELTCNDDRDVEPNDTLAQAFDSGIPDLRADFKVVGLAICPSGDIDLYKFEVASLTNVTVEIEFQPSRGELSLDVLNMSGTSIATGQVVEADPNVRQAQIANLAAGTYFVQVKSATGEQNNYDRVEIKTSL